MFTERSKVKFRKTACAVCRELERGGMKAGEDIFPAALMGRTPCVEPTQRITFVASRSLRYKRFGLLSEGPWPGSVHLGRNNKNQVGFRCKVGCNYKAVFNR